MTFIELVEQVATETGFPKTSVKKMLYATFIGIEAHVLETKGEVKIPGFGKFTAGKTRTGVAFGHKLTPRPTIRFQHYTYDLPGETMEKLGVVFDDSMTKTGAAGSLCPRCGSTLEEPKKCKHCGTEPFEARPSRPSRPVAPKK